MGARGERIIVLPSGDEVNILFTNLALGEAEQRMNKPIMAVAHNLINNQAGIGEVANLLRAGMQAANRDAGRRKEAVSLIDAYKVMDKVGFTTVMTTVMEAVTDVLMYNGSADNDKEPDPDPN